MEAYFKGLEKALENGHDLSHSVENEFFCLKLTAALGLRVPHGRHRAEADVRLTAAALAAQFGVAPNAQIAG